MLKDHQFRPFYESDVDDDAIADLYSSALSEANTCRVIIGSFDVSSMVWASNGIEELIKNNRRMELIACLLLSDKDLNALNDAIDDEEIDDIITTVIRGELTSNSIEEEHIEAMGWMLKNGLLDVKLLLTKNKYGDYCSDVPLHEKMCIISDAENTMVCSSPIDELAFEKDSGDIDVYCDWVDPPIRISKKVAIFDNYWNNKASERAVTRELTVSVRGLWTGFVPSDKCQLKIFKKENGAIHLRDYQVKAIDSWFDNQCIGIFNMATGTGKTLTAIYALRKLLKQTQEKFILVVAVPFQHLVEDPWIKSLIKEINPIRELSIVRAYGSSKIWIKEAKDAFANYRFGVSDNITFVTTYDTLSSDVFTSFIKSIPPKGMKILIADEVHNSGSDKNRDGLLDLYNCRLGLSATPARYLDEDGTEFIQNYFDKEVFTFSLQRAIKEINPDTGLSYLTPYYYHPIFVNMNDDELGDYKNYTNKIAKYVAKEDKTPEEAKIMQSLLIRRSKIVKNAASKIATLSELIPDYKKNGVLNYCLIYCSDGKDPDDETLRSRDRVIRMLNKNHISSRRFTAEENIKERKEILDSFSSGETEVIVAIKCLDEGVDVPATENAIIMASTGNPREYIQRRGRVLRRTAGKKCANIYDFVVVPSGRSSEPEMEKQIFTSEYLRFKEFSDNSLNKEENDELIRKIADEFSIELGESD